MSSSRRWKVPTLAAAVLLARASAAVVVVEHSGYYTPGRDYDVSGDSWITILQPSRPGIPYDFDAFDDSTPPPYEPATIQAITHLPGFAGTVELKVTGHDGREFGADNVDQIVFNYNWGEGPTAKIKAFTIHGTLGTVQGVENYVYSIEADFSAASVARPFHVFEALAGNMTITGNGPHMGTLDIGKFQAPHTITISGSFLGDIMLGQPF
jgi:hypothetical protein